MEQTTQHNKKPSRVLKWAFVVGIVIVLNLLFGVGVSLFYEAPDYDDFCGSDEPVVAALDTHQSCVDAGGQWVEGNTIVDERAIVPKFGSAAEGYCDATFTCRAEFDDAREEYERTVFIILVALGVLAFITSFLVKRYSVVAHGLALGGVLSLIIASIRYWSSASDILRFVILLVALAVLVWFGVKKFKE